MWTTHADWATAIIEDRVSSSSPTGRRCALRTAWCVPVVHWCDCTPRWWSPLVRRSSLSCCRLALHQMRRPRAEPSRMRFRLPRLHDLRDRCPCLWLNGRIWDFFLRGGGAAQGQAVVQGVRPVEIEIGGPYKTVDYRPTSFIRQKRQQTQKQQKRKQSMCK